MNDKPSGLKYQLFRFFITRKVFDWVDYWYSVGFECKQYGVPIPVRSNIARKVVRFTVIR